MDHDSIADIRLGLASVFSFIIFPSGREYSSEEDQHVARGNNLGRARIVTGEVVGQHIVFAGAVRGLCFVSSLSVYLYRVRIWSAGVADHCSTIFCEACSGRSVSVSCQKTSILLDSRVLFDRASELVLCRARKEKYDHLLISCITKRRGWHGLISVTKSDPEQERSITSSFRLCRIFSSIIDVASDSGATENARGSQNFIIALPETIAIYGRRIEQ